MGEGGGGRGEGAAPLLNSSKVTLGRCRLLLREGAFGGRSGSQIALVEGGSMAWTPRHPQLPRKQHTVRLGSFLPTWPRFPHQGVVMSVARTRGGISEMPRSRHLVSWSGHFCR